MIQCMSSKHEKECATKIYELSSNQIDANSHTIAVSTCYQPEPECHTDTEHLIHSQLISEPGGSHGAMWPPVL